MRFSGWLAADHNDYDGRTKSGWPAVAGDPDPTRSVEALTMMYRVVTYDRTTERMKGSLVVPPSVRPKVKKAAGFGPSDDGLGEYPLDKKTDAAGSEASRVQA